ncbi:MAG: porin [Rhodospirillaceae bacterium]
MRLSRPAIGALATAILWPGVSFAADPITVTLGGWVRQYFFVADQTERASEDLNAAGMFTEAKVAVDGRTVLDNGMTVRTYLRFNAEARETSNIDEGFVEIVHSLGRIRAGDRAGVNYSIVGDPVPQAFLSTYEEVIGDALMVRNGITLRDAFTFKRFTGNALGVSYQSPEIAGIQIGVSYHPTTRLVEGPVNRALMPTNAVDVTAKYEGDYSGGTYRVSGGYFHSQSRVGGNDGVAAWNVGAGITYGGWELAGAYMDITPASRLDEQAWTVGLFYAIGPVQLSADYREAKRRAVAGLDVYEFTDRITLQSAYKLGPGISVGLAGFYGDQTDATGLDWDGGGLLSGVKVDF